MKRKDIKEGLVCAVPLTSFGFARCVVTRHSKSAVTVGYFFGPRIDGVPSMVPKGLNPLDAVLVARFGDIPIVNDEWIPIGYLDDWERTEWPSTDFVRHDPRGRVYLVRYDELDPNRILEEVACDDPAKPDLPSDGLFGYLIIKQRLSAIIK